MPKDNRLLLQNEDELSPEMTFEEFILYVADDEMPFSKKLKLYSKVGERLIQRVFLMIFDARDKHQLIQMGAQPSNFVLQKSKLTKKAFHPFEPRTIEFEAIPVLQLSLFKNHEADYDKFVFDTWDGDFLGKVFDKDFWIVNGQTSAHFSLEMYLMTYMYMWKNYRKTNTYWLEDLASDTLFMKHFKTTHNILYYALPKIIKILKSNKHYQKRYKEFEKKLFASVRLLSDKSGKEQFKILQSSKKLRTFLDAIKTRSHLPTVYGMYLMNIMEALEMNKKDMKKYIQNPTRASNKTLSGMLGYYWMQLLLPFDETK